MALEATNEEKKSRVFGYIRYVECLLMVYLILKFKKKKNRKFLYSTNYEENWENVKIFKSLKCLSTRIFFDKRKTFCSFIKTYHIEANTVSIYRATTTTSLCEEVGKFFLKPRMVNQIYLKRAGFDMNLTKLLCYYADG